MKDLVLLGWEWTEEAAVLDRVRGAEGVERVWVWPGVVKGVVGALKGRGAGGVGVVAVGGWPWGQGKVVVRAIEVSSAVKDGARGVVVCVGAGRLVGVGRGEEGAVGEIRDELTEMARAGRAASPEVWLGVMLHGELMVKVEAGGAGRVGEGVGRAAVESGFDAVVGWGVGGEVVREVREGVRRVGGEFVELG